MISMVLFYGRTGRLTTLFGDFRPGQIPYIFFEKLVDVCSEAICQNLEDDKDISVSMLYQSSWYLKTLTVELNQSAVEQSRTSVRVADALLASSGDDDDTVVVIKMLDKMNLGCALEKPEPVNTTMDRRRMMTVGARGEQLYDPVELDAWWQQTHADQHHADHADVRRRFLHTVRLNNNFRVKIAAVCHLFKSWKEAVETIVLRNWTSAPGSHNRANNDRKVRRLLTGLLGRIREWSPSVSTPEPKYVIQAVLLPLSELVSLALSNLSGSINAAGEADQEMPREEMLEILVVGILACDQVDQGARIRANLYTAMLHILWWCGVSRGGPWSANGARPQANTELKMIGRLLDRHVGTTGSKGQSLLSVIALDASAQTAQEYASQMRPLPLVQTLALCVLETVVRNDWGVQGRWLDRLERDRFLDHILISLPYEIRVDQVGKLIGAQSSDLSPDQMAQFYVLETQLTLTASLAGAPRRSDQDNAIVNLLPRLRDSWTFLSKHFLSDRHRLGLLLHADGDEVMAKRYHQLVIPAIRTLVNVLVTHENNRYVLEQVCPEKRWHPLVRAAFCLFRY
jgi:hypothetical protein